MRIALITNTSPGLPVSEYAIHLIEEIEKTDNELVVIGNTCTKELQGCSAKLIRAWKYDSLLAWLQILIAVLVQKPDVVWYNITLGAFGNGFANLFGLMTPTLLKLLGFQVIITLHNLVDVVDLKKVQLKGGRIAYWGAKAATWILVRAGTVCVLLPEYAEILRNNYRAPLVYVIPHGTLGHIPAAPRPSIRHHQKFTLLAFGIFGTHKPLEPLLDAMAMLQEESDVSLLVAGGSNAHNPSYLSTLQNSYDLRNVKFLGYVPEDCVEQTFAQADAVILTNVENSGKSGALVQAGMYGKPVIAGDLQVFRCEEDQGFQIQFCDPTDPCSIASVIMDMKAASDIQLYEQGVSNFTAATQYPMSKVVETYLQIMESAKHQTRHILSSKTTLWAAILLIAAINIGLLFRPFLSQNWDSEMHLFFASHYQNNLFNPVDFRWYGGMYVFTSAPLVQQLIALVGKVVGLETGYLIVQGIVLTCFPLAVYSLAKELLPKGDTPTAELAALLSTGIAGTYVLLYTFGQLPAFSAIVICLFAATSLCKYLRTGKPIDFLGWFFLSGAAIATNHHTSILMLSLMATGFVLSDWCRKPFRKVKIVRAVLAAIGLVSIALLAVLPFWWWYLTQNLKQADILHPTREAFLPMAGYADMFFWDIYGGLLFLAPFALVSLRKLHFLPILGLIVFLFILGLGGNTPIPRIMLGPLWGVLTYERFPFLAAILATIPIAMGLKGVARLIPFKKFHLFGSVVIGLILVLGIGKAISFPQQRDLLQKPPQSWEEDEVVKFLDEHSEWKFITIGAGEPELARLTIRSTAETVDGFYNQGRTNPLLRASGQGTIDSEAWGMYPQDYTVFFNVLQHPEDWGVRWVVSFTPWAEEHLNNSHWNLLHPVGSHIGWKVGDRAYSNITFWEAPAEKVAVMKTSAELDAIKQAQLPKGPLINLLAVWWAIVPMTLLVLGSGIFLIGTRVVTKDV